MKQIFLVAISSVVLMSCKNEVKSTDSEKTTEIEQVQTSNESSDKIELNNNEKWAVNDEMKPYILQGEELVNSYLQTNNTDYVGLAKQLKELNTKLIKSCTMEGKSHDELHKWLHPHLELVGKLENAPDAENGKVVAKQVSDSYATYHQHFN